VTAASPPSDASARAGWTIPPAAAFLAVAVLSAGIAAARVAAPVLWIFTPIVTALILSAGVKRVRALETDLDASTLPPPLRRAVGSAAAELPPGEARQLLAAVVRQSRAILAADDERFTRDSDNALRGNVADLVAACCNTAMDLARLDAFLGSTALSPPSNVARADLDARARAARSIFARRLADAELALRSLYTTGIECGTPATDRVAELANEIMSEAGARRAANDELHRLLGGSA
jgi:hypothetical protein